MPVQYIGGYHEYTGGYQDYTGGFQYIGVIVSTPGVSSTLGDIIQFTRGCSVYWGTTMNTLGDTIMHVGGYHKYTRGFQYTEGYHQYSGGIRYEWGKVATKFLELLFLHLLRWYSYMSPFGTWDNSLKFLHQVARAQTLLRFFFHLWFQWCPIKLWVIFMFKI